MKNVTLTNGDTTTMDDAYFPLFEKGRDVKDTYGCYIPFESIESICDAPAVAVVGTSTVGNAVVG